MTILRMLFWLAPGAAYVALLMGAEWLDQHPMLAPPPAPQIESSLDGSIPASGTMNEKKNRHQRRRSSDVSCR